MNFARDGPITQSPFINPPHGPNVIDGGGGGFSATQMATHPSNKITVGKHIFVVDSRQRDVKLYPSPSRYRIEVGDVFKNISSIELKGVILPKSCYNVHSSNKYIDFVIGDFVSQIVITNAGSGYIVPPLVIISPPLVGITATTTSTINANGEVDNIIITLGGAVNSKHIVVDPKQVEKVITE